MARRRSRGYLDLSLQWRLRPEPEFVVAGRARNIRKAAMHATSAKMRESRGASLPGYVRNVPGHVRDAPLQNLLAATRPGASFRAGICTPLTIPSPDSGIARGPKTVRELAIAMLFACSAALVPAAMVLAPRADSPVAVIMPPWATNGDALRIVAAAGGSLVATAGDGRIAIARFAGEGFVSGLYRAGALFVLDATAVSACFGLSLTQSASTPGTST